MSNSIQKLRIFAMLMRCKEIQESKIRKIQLIHGGRSFGKVLAIGMDFGPVTIVPDLTEKHIDKNQTFNPFDIADNEVIIKNDSQSKYFGKPKNNYRR